MSHKAELYESWWHDRDHVDQWEMVGEWASKFPWQLDESWALYADILKVAGLTFKNAWAMDAKHQEAFVKFLEDTSDGWQSFRDSAFQDWCEELEGRGWSANDSE